MASIDGLVSGLNTTQIISQLMSVERASGNYLTQGKADSQNMATVLQALNATLTGLQTATSALIPDSITKASAWTSATAGSNVPGLATATTGASAAPGTATFTVRSVASAGSSVTTGSVGSLTSAVSDGPLLLGKGIAALGMASITAGSQLAGGAHALVVTQSSAGAALTGAPLADSITVDAGSSTMSVEVDGTPTSITLTQGTYTRDQLAAEVGRASGGTLSASIGTDGSLRLATSQEGSAATLRLGAANAALGLSDTGTTATGTDGVVTLDGVATTVASLTRGSQITLNGANGDSMVFTMSGGLRSGTASATVVQLSSGSNLSQVVSSINGAGAGMRATAVQVSANAYRLQLTSTSTGADSDVSLGQGAFPPGLSGLGGTVELSAGSDTLLRVGTGPGAFDVTSSTTSVAGLLPGVTITAVKADPTTPVTITVDQDSAGIANKMDALVTAANAVLGYISDKSSYNADSKTAGPLLGSALTRDLSQRIVDNAIGTSSDLPSLAGVQVGRDGKIAFDKTAFLAAYAKDPAAVEKTMTAFATRLAGTTKAASDPISGYVTGQITSEQAKVKDYTDQIASFEVRMTLRQQTLQTQYASLETMLGTLKSQSAWLAGQLASLPTPSSGNN
ncbi:flagellar filament capping protein FliD [Pedococcus sp. KACC 23699]|uniref:Flagellar hook-associated protein 2 n=1 Tax=Pedococcus sp. KACC 23699 TaxID=3149228 RepID=A0AAU7JZH4_9MICO